MSRFTLDICIDTTATPPPPPSSSAGAGERFFAVSTTFRHVASGQVASSSQRRHSLVPREVFMEHGLGALGIPAPTTANEILAFALEMFKFAEEAASRDDGAAVVPVRMIWTAYTDDDYDAELARRESEADAVLQTVPASESSIEALPNVVAMDNDNDNDQDQCTICLGDYDDNDDPTAAKMPCSHVFHRECLVRWLKTSHVCPLCRYAMPTSSLD